MNFKIISTTLGVAITVLGLASCEIDWSGKRDRPVTGMIDADLPSCTVNTDCPAGFCDTAVSLCSTSTPCSADLPPCSTASECDARGVCVPDTDCHVDADCTTGTHCQPYADSTIGHCVADATGCVAITNERTCFADAACAASYTGTDCKAADGSACDVADSGCTCASYRFAACEAR